MILLGVSISNTTYEETINTGSTTQCISDSVITSFGNFYAQINLWINPNRHSYNGIKPLQPNFAHHIHRYVRGFEIGGWSKSGNSQSKMNGY
jgi:hypothetical protein